MEYFKDCGGLGIEVASSQQKPADHEYLCELCKKYDFLASLGSDFHNIGPYRELGFNLSIPDDLKKVWETSQAKEYHFI